MQFPESWLRAFCNPRHLDRPTGRYPDHGWSGGRRTAGLWRLPFTASWWARSSTPSSIPMPIACACARSMWAKPTLLNIVCGAPNARVGIRVPCALVGAELPPGEDGKPFLIKVGKLRGVESQGMLCSASELQPRRRPWRPAGAACRTRPWARTSASTCDLDDTLFTLKLHAQPGALPERVWRRARGLGTDRRAAVCARLCQPRSVHDPATKCLSRSAPRPVWPFLGPRRPRREYQGHKRRSGWWTAWRVAASAASAALVDISNYVMFELGRPAHIFDLDKIHGGLDVRWGKQGEQLKLLNGNTVDCGRQGGRDCR